MPIGVPGCPELACCTASIERVRIVLIDCVAASSGLQGGGVSTDVIAVFIRIGVLRAGNAHAIARCVPRLCATAKRLVLNRLGIPGETELQCESLVGRFFVREICEIPVRRRGALPEPAPRRNGRRVSGFRLARQCPPDGIQHRVFTDGRRASGRSTKVSFGIRAERHGADERRIRSGIRSFVRHFRASSRNPMPAPERRFNSPCRSEWRAF
jgi:hypothetical protein